MFCPRRSTSPLIALAMLSLTASVLAQRPGKPGGGPGGGPVDMSNAASPIPELNNNPRSLYVSGKVVFQGGRTSTEHIMIERVCGGVVRREGYANSKGEFQIELGRHSSERDASQMDSDRMVTGHVATTTEAGHSQLRFEDCELRAWVPGFSSTSVTLRIESDMGQVDVGTIVLRPLGDVQGTTLSVTTMSAPSEARRAYEKGQKAAAEKKFDEAEKDLRKAVELYPQFAAAWSVLAEVHRLQNHFDLARTEYGKALATDPKFVAPYFGLAAIDIIEKKWAEAVQVTDQLFTLNSFAYPMAYFYNGAANFNMGNLDAAEQSIRKFQSMDQGHSRPDAPILLGSILTAKHDYAGAAQQYRAYLAANPNAPNKNQLSSEAQRLEALTAASK